MSMFGNLKKRKFNLNITPPAIYSLDKFATNFIIVYQVHLPTPSLSLSLHFSFYSKYMYIYIIFIKVYEIFAI